MNDFSNYSTSVLSLVRRFVILVMEKCHLPSNQKCADYFWLFRLFARTQSHFVSMFICTEIQYSQVENFSTPLHFSRVPRSPSTNLHTVQLYRRSLFESTTRISTRTRTHPSSWVKHFLVYRRTTLNLRICLRNIQVVRKLSPNIRREKMLGNLSQSKLLSI